MGLTAADVQAAASSVVDPAWLGMFLRDLDTVANGQPLDNVAASILSLAAPTYLTGARLEQFQTAVEQIISAQGTGQPPAQ